MLQGRKNYIQNTKTKDPGTERITTRNGTHPKGSKTEKGKGDTRENNCDAPLIEQTLTYFNIFF
jgi:hypothetical protein